MSNFAESFFPDYDKGKEIYDWCFNVVFELFNGVFIMIKEDLEELLREINVILQKEKVKKAESRKRGERFNMFELLGVAHYELKHSKIIFTIEIRI